MSGLIDTSGQLLPMLPEREPSTKQLMQQIINSPNAKEQVEVLRELIAMQERQEDREAKRVFADALHDMQAEITIYKDATIEVKGKMRSQYASWENLDEILKPLMDKYGFSYIQSVAEIKDGTREYVGTLMHRNGAERNVSYFLPLDKSDFRSLAQSEGATSTYAKRQIYKQLFNLTERAPQIAESVETISKEKALEFNTRMQDAKANIPVFLEYFKIEKLEDLKQVDCARAEEAIAKKEARRKAEQQQAETNDPA